MLGGIGSGKSYVARTLRAMDMASVVDADELAHGALDACARDGRLEAAFGPGFVRDDGQADRAALAAHVFEEPAMLRRLESLTHPSVMALVKSRITDHRVGEGPPVLVLDVPLLLEVGLDRQCDALWFIDAPEDLRMVRAGQRGLSAEQTRLREKHQSPLERKKARADFTIRNDVDDEALVQQLRAGLEILGVRPLPQA